VQFLNTVRRVELRQQFQHSAGNIAGHDYQRFASTYFTREDERGGSQLGRLLAEWLRSAEAVFTEEMRGVLRELIGALQRETCHVYGSQPRGLRAG